jgi:hypothetical protein
MKIKSFAGAALCGALMTGCVATVGPGPVVEYEPAVIVGAYPLGYYGPAGYWTGYGWDRHYYDRGHPGWGHYYRGAPRYARDYYHRR